MGHYLPEEIMGIDRLRSHVSHYYELSDLCSQYSLKLTIHLGIGVRPRRHT